MPEDTNLVEENATQSATAEPGKTFTQDQVNKLMGDTRQTVRRQFQEKYADYDELKAKAAKFDELEEAGKSELQKAVEELNKYKAMVEDMKAEKAKAEAVAKAAAEYGVDAEILTLMTGDVEENAKRLKSKLDAQPKHGAAPDFGEANAPAGKKSTADQFAESITII